MTESKDTTPVLQNIHKWFEACYPQKDARLIELQLGVMLEEVTEVLKALGLPHHQLEETADHLKDSRYTAFIEHQFSNPEIRTEVLDGLCDINVTTVAVGYAADMKHIEGLIEVNKSNFSKFDKEGKPIFDPITGKVAKGEQYTKPDLHRLANPEGDL